MSPDLLIDRLNSLDQAGFVSEVGPLYEHSPWIASLVSAQRPFSDRAALREAMRQAVRDAGRDRQLALIRAHPDLAGRLARAGALAVASAREQSGLGLDRLDDAEFERFDALNSAYRQRFGMPFIIAVRAQTRQSVIAAFEQRIRHDLATEIAAALDEIDKIAAFRLDDLDPLRPDKQPA